MASENENNELDIIQKQNAGFSLWRFSLQFYAIKDIPNACLILQDDCGADVNIVLFILWSALNRRAFSSEDITKIENIVVDWREKIVVKLRSIRRDLRMGEGKPDVAALRQQVKHAELESERVEQLMLFECAAGLGMKADPELAAESSLRHYAASLGVVFPEVALRYMVKSALYQIPLIGAHESSLKGRWP